MIVVAINGGPRFGKDTFVEMCTEVADIINISSIDVVNQAMSILGWDGVTKDPAYRNATAAVKQVSMKYNDGPMKYIIKTIEDNQYGAIKLLFVHIREPIEIHRLMLHMQDRGIEFVSLLVKNNKAEKFEGNTSDANVEQFCYNVVIDNTGTLDDLRVEAHNFVNKLVAED